MTCKTCNTPGDKSKLINGLCFGCTSTELYNLNLVYKEGLTHRIELLGTIKRLEAACAEKDAALNKCISICEEGIPDAKSKRPAWIQAAVSDGDGQGWLSPAEAEKLREWDKIMGERVNEIEARNVALTKENDQLQAQCAAMREALGDKGPHKWVLKKRGLYYRPNACGYTDNILEAWVVSESVADQHTYPHDEPVTKHRYEPPEFARAALRSDAGAALLKELDELREWKQQALAVEASWDKQAVGRLLRIKLGEDICPAIEPAILSLLKRLWKAESKLEEQSHLVEIGEQLQTLCGTLNKTNK